MGSLIPWKKLLRLNYHVIVFMSHFSHYGLKWLSNTTQVNPCLAFAKVKGHEWKPITGCRETFTLNWRDVVVEGGGEQTRHCIKYNFIKLFSFHWHFYQYRNKISSKTGERHYVVPIGDFDNSKILHVRERNMMPGKTKIYFHIVIFFLSYSV